MWPGSAHLTDAVGMPLAVPVPRGRPPVSACCLPAVHCSCCGSGPMRRVPTEGLEQARERHDHSGDRRDDPHPVGAATGRSSGRTRSQPRSRRLLPRRARARPSSFPPVVIDLPPSTYFQVTLIDGRPGTERLGVLSGSGPPSERPCALRAERTPFRPAGGSETGVARAVADPRGRGYQRCPPPLSGCRGGGSVRSRPGSSPSVAGERAARCAGSRHRVLYVIADVRRSHRLGRLQLEVVHHQRAVGDRRSVPATRAVTHARVRCAVHLLQLRRPRGRRSEARSAPRGVAPPRDRRPEPGRAVRADAPSGGRDEPDRHACTSPSPP